MRKTAGILFALLFCLSTLSAEETQYTNYSFARLSYVTGKTFLQRATDLGFEEGTVNMPISEGDRFGTTDGRAEIFLGKGNYVRLNNDTKIDFLKLPKKGYDLVRIRILLGNVYFRVQSLEEEKNIEIHTPDVSFYVLDKGLYRIDVRENNEIELFVYQGMVEAAGETGSVLVKDEQRLETANGRFTSRPTRFYAAAEDSFDRWSEFRDSQIRTRLAETYLPEELEDYENELAENGYWTFIQPYGNVWVPQGIASDWRPYYYGRWTWLSLCGWTWIPYESWGWSTYHYGRWHWGLGHGWYWIPTSIWGPAWVSWYGGYDYFGWAPLSYYGYPGVILNNRYYGRYGGSSYPYNSRALTVIHKNQLKARNVSKSALSRESVRSLGKTRLSSLQQPLRPTASEVTIERTGGKKLLLWKSSRPAEAGKRERPGRDSVRRMESGDSKRIEGKAVRSTRSVQERKIIPKIAEKGNRVGTKKPSAPSRGAIRKGSYGYPSSPKISIKNYPRRIKTRKSSSLLGRIYQSITGNRRVITRRGSSSGSSRVTTSKKSSSRSRSSSASSRKSSSSRSSRSSSSTSSSKVKKKK